MTKSYSYFSRLRDKPRRAEARPSAKQRESSRRLTVVTTPAPDRQADLVSALAAVGPSDDF